jgi:hypothetical protein
MIVVPLSAEGIRYTSIILGAALIVSILGAVALVDYRQVHDEEDVYNRDRGRRANTSHSTRTSANASRCGGTLPPGVGAGAQAVQATPLSLYMLSTREIFLLKNSKEPKILLGFWSKGFTAYPDLEPHEAKHFGAASPC